MAFNLGQARAALERTPSVLEGLIGGLPSDWLSARPAEEEWSAHQVVCHLAYVEETNWIGRAHMIRDEGPMRPFPPVDRGDQSARYAGQDTSDVARRFSELRTQNLAELDRMALTDADLDRRGLHPTLGEVTMHELIATWVVHDHNHVAQLQGSLAAYYATDVGPWRSLLGILDRVKS